MRICLISKFPPIQGGISAKTYWIAQGLAERGIETHVVTNGKSAEKEYFIDDTPPEKPSNLIIHFLDSDIPWHIPYSELYTPGLLDKTLEVINENHIDLIDTHYLIPYGIVGYLASKITGIPYIVRHGGSDITKFLKDGIFEHLLGNVIRDAAAVITDDKNKGLFENLNSNVQVLPRYIPNEKYFEPSFTPHETPTFAYIGKINYYWRHKSLDKITDIFAGVTGQHRLLFISQGKGFKDFSEFVLERGLSTCEFRQFVHPMNVPRLLKEIDFLLYFIKDNLIKDFSNILSEALCSGVPVLTDDTMDMSEYTKYIELETRDQIITLPMDDVEAAQAQVNDIINTWKGPSRYTNKVKYNFKGYMGANLDIYSGI